VGGVGASDTLTGEAKEEVSATEVDGDTAPQDAMDEAAQEDTSADEVKEDGKQGGDEKPQAGGRRQQTADRDRRQEAGGRREQTR